MASKGQPYRFTIELLNWQLLAGKGGQLKEDKLAEAIQAGAEQQVDVILGTELGTTPLTEPLCDGPYSSDWSTHPSVKAGQGVGAFFTRTGDFNWILLIPGGEPAQSRFYLLMHSNQSMLLGVFYAPHAGKPQALRIEFYKRLHIAWLAHSRAHPGASKVLAGDANIPELHYDINGEMSPTEGISKFWCEEFMPGMLCANTHKGQPAATHLKGNALDLIIYSPDLCLEKCEVGQL